MTMNSGSGCFNTVVFNDGEILHRQNKASALDCCFAMPEYFSPDDIHDVLPAVAAEQQQQQEEGVNAQVPEESIAAFDFPVDFSKAFGFVDNDEAGMDHQITTPPKASSKKLHNASPTSVIPSVHDNDDDDAPTKQEHRRRQMCRSRMNSRSMGLAVNSSFNTNSTRKPVSLGGYCIGDESKLNDSISIEVSNEEAALAAKSLEIGDAAFILRSDCKWTYAIVIHKAVVLEGMVGQNALRFEVGADGRRKTFMEGQWGKYVRVIKTTNSTALLDEQDLSCIESDPYDEILNDTDHSNHDTGASAVYKRSRSSFSPKPKGILRNKQNNAVDGRFKSKVLERSKSEGCSVQFRTNWIYYDDNEKVDTTVMQTPSESDLQLLAKVCHKKDSRMKKAVQSRLRCPEPVTSPPTQSTSSESNFCVDESCDVGQLLSTLTQPQPALFSWQCSDVDEKDIVHEEDIVESLTIECELQDDDEKFHEVHILAGV